MPAQSNSNDNEFTPNGELLAVDLLLASDLASLDAGGPEVEFDPEEDRLSEPMFAPSAPRGRARQAAGARSISLTEGPASVYIRLVDYGLLRKMTDIVMAKVSVPWHLREDAAQEVHTAWASLIAKPHFARNQLARYAYISGQHAALKLRRNIGAVVAIPGALFRTGRDSAFMEAIGAAVNPKDVEDYKDSLELSVDAAEYVTPAQAVSTDYFKTRVSGLALTRSQRTIAEHVLVRRMSAESIAHLMQVRVSYVERLISQVVQLLNDKDDADLAAQRKRKSKPAALAGKSGR